MNPESVSPITIRFEAVNPKPADTVMVNLVFLISEKVDFETVGSGLGCVSCGQRTQNHQHSPP